MGPENAATRWILMDATEMVMREEGYAAVTSRRVAERAGVNQQTVYYYFQTMEDLLLATYRRRTKTVLENLERAMASERPLHSLWRTMSDPFDAALTMEYLALANHNDAIRRETIEFGEHLRSVQVDKLTEHIKGALANVQVGNPLAIVMVLTYIAHVLGFEATIGIRGGHKEVRSVVEWCLRQIEPVSSRAKAAGI
jgi:AcrR family transcriptional regulator